MQSVKVRIQQDLGALKSRKGDTGESLLVLSFNELTQSRKRALAEQVRSH